MAGFKEKPKTVNKKLNGFGIETLTEMQQALMMISTTNLTEFNQRLFERDSKELMHLMEYGEDDSGIIPDYILFHSGTMIPLMFLFNTLDQVKSKDGDAINNKMVKKYYQQFKESFDQLHPKGASKQYLEPLHSFKNLTENGMPYYASHVFHQPL
ncbi:hypothetical protein GQR58_020367 [Nymphon striatum]|nr:hypothetical protein GQR58_020367 [Nymphon striatum]